MSTSRVKLKGVCFVITTLLAMIPLSLCEHHNNHNFFNDKGTSSKNLRFKGSFHEDKRGVFGEFNIPEDEPDCSSIAFCDVCIAAGPKGEVKCVLCSGKRKPSLNGDSCERQDPPNFQGKFNFTKEGQNPLDLFSKAFNEGN